MRTDACVHAHALEQSGVEHAGGATGDSLNGLSDALRQPYCPVPRYWH
jgi:thiamine pyrophosphate-dependent acetolactate synthase large subunit-like protein